MKQIKTIQNRCGYSEDFDRDVNNALADGWNLVERLVLCPYEGDKKVWHRMYVAYLEKDV